MKYRLERYYPVENGKHGITHLRVDLHHYTHFGMTGFHLFVTPVERKNGMVSEHYEFGMPTPHIFVMSGRYTQKRYEQLKGNFGSLISDMFDSWLDNPFEIDQTNYEQREVAE